MKPDFLHFGYLLIFIIFCNPLFAQKSIEYDPSHQFAYMRNSDIESKNVDFIYYEYHSTKLNLAHFKLSFPELSYHVPSYADIVPPRKNMENFAYAVGYITNEGNINDGAVVIMLVGNYSKHPIFYIDENMDNDFTNDSGPFVFRKSSKKQKWIKLQNHKNKKKRYDFYLVNPAYQEELATKEFDPYDSSVWEKTKEKSPKPKKPTAEKSSPKKELKYAHNFFRNGVFAEFSIYAGTSRLDYYHETAVDIYPIHNYRVHYNPRGVGLELGYAFQNFQLSLFGSFEKIYYQTSTLQTTSVYFSTLINRYRTTGEIFSNIDHHPSEKYSYGLSLGYNIKLSRNIFVMPYAHYGKYHFDMNYYFPNYVNNPGEKYELTNRQNFGVGGKFSILVHKRGAITVNLRYSNFTFDPEGFFEPVEKVNNLRTSNSQVSFGIGFQTKFIELKK